MKNIFKKIANLFKSAYRKVEDKFNSAAYSVRSLFTRSTRVLSGTRAEGYVDTGVKILIAVVIGALLLAGLYSLFNGTILPTVNTKVKGLFNYSGT